jgi:biotin operon repressor
LSDPTSSTSESRAQASRSKDRFTHDQFDWLRRVASDGDLPPAAARISIALTRFFNRAQDSWAWISQATLARHLGLSERTVRYALSALERRGHLVTRRRGRMETNKYRLAHRSSACDRQTIADHDRQQIAIHDRQSIAAHSAVTGKSGSGDRQDSAQVTGNGLPPGAAPKSGTCCPPLFLCRAPHNSVNHRSRPTPLSCQRPRWPAALASRRSRGR